MYKDKVILGFETSCDETAIAIMKDSKLLVNKISSQVDMVQAAERAGAGDAGRGRRRTCAA